MRTLIKIMILVQCITIFSCDMLKFGGKEKVGEIDKVINGICKIQIKLKFNTAGWAIHIGDPYGNPTTDDFNKNLIEKNKIIMNKRLTLNFINDSKFDMRIGHNIIPPKSKITYFEGTLENLITNTNPIALTNINGKKYEFTLEFRFDEKDIKIKSPIPIVASWNDAL